MFKSDTVLVASHCVEVCLFTGHKKEEKRQTTDNSRLGDKKALTVCCRLLVRRTEFSVLVLHKHERLWKAACWYAVAPCDPLLHHHHHSFKAAAKNEQPSAHITNFTALTPLKNLQYRFIPNTRRLYARFLSPLPRVTAEFLSSLYTQACQITPRHPSYSENKTRRAWNLH